MVKKFDSLLGQTVGFCGVDCNAFCVIPSGGKERLAFEVLVDEEDGYRSSLKDVINVPVKGHVFFWRPVALLMIRERPASVREWGWELVDAAGHVWLTFGTSATDDWYPYFFFDYSPSQSL